jgi:hypothetical protein
MKSPLLKSMKPVFRAIDGDTDQQTFPRGSPPIVEPLSMRVVMAPGVSTDQRGPRITRGRRMTHEQKPIAPGHRCDPSCHGGVESRPIAAALATMGDGRNFSGRLKAGSNAAAR